jgi:hypothetical protein
MHIPDAMGVPVPYLADTLRFADNPITGLRKWMLARYRSGNVEKRANRPLLLF